MTFLWGIIAGLFLGELLDFVERVWKRMRDDG